MLVLLVVLALGVAYANGANDVSKGIGTLVGSGLASYRRALVWGTLWTVAGGAAAVVVSFGLVRTFSTAVVTGTPDEGFLLAVAAGACGWVLLASRTGLPVSTTHALAGAIVGAALVDGGFGAIHWPLLTATVVLPLAASPLVAAAIAYTLQTVAARPLSRAARYCVCVESRPVALVPAYAAAEAALPGESVGAARLEVDRQERCDASTITSRVRLTDAAHWGSSAALSFARGLNDNPKIMALAVAALVGSGSSSAAVWLMAAGAAAMGLGGYLYGHRVTTTLAEHVTTIDPLEGLTASSVASALVLAASFVALPVSTTHVATGAIVGAGLPAGAGSIAWRMVGRIGAAWVVTLPAAGLLAAGVAWL